ncbi:GGDEF domain-containing protein [Shewanella sp. NIFS-20-20]|uniref:GGDEF domain-containing protein n=1 Tax=Shewanella sp. NIFS-20-20 TaxID=2853806 RepID=UPI001C44C1E3|nr:GGDEF domain-containing protein [Shewanella sp. NIFS-20-20]MBV7316785.1 GGDEF domain-containing protein [Shewanella sp. NIFS-20-20]
MTIIAVCLVFIGLIGLIASVRPAYIILHLSDYQHKGWLMLVGMIGMFILGYIGFIYMLVDHMVSMLELVVAAIFCGGGAFVFVITCMSRQTIGDLMRTLKDNYYQAHHDSLTGLDNRHQFYLDLEKMFGSQAPYFCCMMLDLNKFKLINDNYGHSYGDHVLKVVAERLINSVPEDAITARLGGDELAVLLPGYDSDMAIRIAQTIQQSLLTPIEYEGATLSIGVSIGISQYPTDGHDKTSLMINADIAMYQAKRNDSHYQIYQPELSLDSVVGHEQ